MDIRKTLNDIKSSINGRTMSDLEKRKLEAELKAAEEMAKLKEVVIEKRLAYELASLENGNNREASVSLIPQSNIKNSEASLPKSVKKPANCESAEAILFSKKSESIGRLSTLPERKPSTNASRVTIQNIQKSLDSEYSIPISTVFSKVTSSNSRKLSQGNVRAPFTDTRNPGLFVSSDKQYVTPPCDDDLLKNYDAGSRVADDDEDSEEDEEDEDYEEGRLNEFSSRRKKLTVRWKSMVSRVKSKLKLLKPRKW